MDGGPSSNCYHRRPALLLPYWKSDNAVEETYVPFFKCLQLLPPQDKYWNSMRISNDSVRKIGKILSVELRPPFLYQRLSAKASFRCSLQGCRKDESFKFPKEKFLLEIKWQKMLLRRSRKLFSFERREREHILRTLKVYSSRAVEWLRRGRREREEQAR